VEKINTICVISMEKGYFIGAQEGITIKIYILVLNVKKI
jgi:hypothetical protein